MEAWSYLLAVAPEDTLTPPTTEMAASTIGFQWVEIQNLQNALSVPEV